MRDRATKSGGPPPPSGGGGDAQGRQAVPAEESAGESPRRADPDESGSRSDTELASASGGSSPPPSPSAEGAPSAAEGARARPAPGTPAPAGYEAGGPGHGGRRLGRYELVSHLGSGGMAEVYRARDLELRRDVAVKVLLPHLSRDGQVVSRFHREARAAAGLDHPHILRVYDVGGGVLPGGADADDPHGEAPDPPFIVLEFVSGGTLADWAGERAPIPAEIAACLGVVIAGALGAVHRAGIVHRDVKPANLLFGSDGRLLLSDFGVARVEGGDSLITRDGAVLGTPAFMAPEQAFGEGQCARSDLYALGATLYYLTTGSVPVGGPMTKALALLAAGDIPDPLRRNRAMGPAFASVLRVLMARDPAARYPDAESAAEALAEVAKPLAGDDPEAMVSRYFAAPESEAARAREIALKEALGQGRALARRDPPRALALADRALALEPGSREAEAIVARVSSGRRRRRAAIAIATAGVLAGAGAFAIAEQGSGYAKAGAASAERAAGGSAGGEGGDRGGAGASESPERAGGSAWASLFALGAPEGRPVAGEPELAGERSPPDASGASGAGSAQGPNAPAEGGSAQGPNAPAGAGSAQGSSAPAAYAEEPGARPEAGSVGADAEGGELAGEAERENEVRAGDEGGGDESGGGESGGDESAGDESAGDEGGEGPGAVAGSAESGDPEELGRLVVEADSWCDLEIGGRPAERVHGSLSVELSAGTYELACSQGAGLGVWTSTVEIEAGETLRVEAELLARVTVSVALEAGDRVRVGGRELAHGDRRRMRPGRYRIEVWKEDRRLEQGWVSIPREDTCVLRDHPAVGCY